MGKKKHPFINKKNAQTFSLVHRSQRDPLQADEESGQRVLVPIEGASGETASQLGDDPTKYGIDFEDDYDYMQHLKPRGEGFLVLADGPTPYNVTQVSQQSNDDSGKIPFGNLLLPQEALPSQYEEDEGLLNKGVLPRGPQPDWDPEIVAALDDAIDFDDPDNVLEDDFMQLANADGNGLQYEGYEDDDMMDMPHMSHGLDRDNEGYNYDSDNLDNDSDFDLESDFSEEETKTRFTNYSMTSSVIRRTQELQLLDDRFERIMEEYDEEEMGCVDHEEVAGMIRPDTDLFNQAIENFIDEQTPHKLAEAYEDVESGDEKDKIGSDDSEEESDEKLFAQFEKKPKAEWDCESIISTYSNIYNHPKMIPIEKKITVSGKTGLPVGVLQKKEKNTVPVIEEKEVILNNKRNKGETADERKQRKQAVKESRKNRRVEKKSNKIAFKTEQIKQEKLMTNVMVQEAIKL